MVTPLHTASLVEFHNAILGKYTGNFRKNAPDSLAYYFAEKTLVDIGKELKPLRNEMDAAVQPLTEPGVQIDPNGNMLGSAKLPLVSILQDYKKRCAQDLSDDERRALERLREENSQLLLKLRSVQAQLDASTEKQERLEQELGELKVLPSVNTEELVKKEQLYIEESEKLLLQLHHVQEELESSFIKQQQRAEALAASEKAADRASGELDQVRHKLEESTQHNEQLLLHLNQAQEELEHYFLQHQQAKEEINKLVAENKKLTHLKEAAMNQAKASNRLFGCLGGWRSLATGPQLTYKAIQLRREQVNPDYEHLWVTLRDATFGEQYAPKWDFRLSCAGVKPNDFGKQPKLEIPKQSDQLLQSWFEESESEHGKKLELRFALPGAMDSGVWRQIGKNDQALVRSLLEQLPALLSELKETGSKISRDWSDWQKLAMDMARILKKKTKN